MSAEQATTPDDRADPADGAAPARGLLDRCRFRGARVTWDDVVGHEAAKRELRVVSAQIRRHSVAQQLGLTLVSGVLVTGPAGSGKTLLAKALAADVDRPVYVVPAAEADATLIRQVYDALAAEPCVVVWDEADVILRSRRGRPDEGRAVAAFCAALDGVSPLRGPITICLTAEPEYALDPSALRAGRLTTHVELAPPDRAERLELWRRYVATVPVAGELDLEKVTDRSVGLTGADIASMVMVGLGLSILDGTDALRQELLDEAVLRGNRIQERPPRRAEVLRRAAVHEAGHVLFAARTWGPASLASVSLRDVGDELGTTTLDDAFFEQEGMDARRIRERVAWSVAGMAAEELVYGPTATSARSGSDISKATSLVRTFITHLGGSVAIGPVDISVVERGSDSDRGSEAMRHAVWAEVHAETAAAFGAAQARLADSAEDLVAFADILLRAESRTLSGPALLAALEPPEEPR